jgi:hypothetical protein
MMILDSSMEIGNVDGINFQGTVEIQTQIVMWGTKKV